MDNGKDDNNAVSCGIIGGHSIGNKCQKRDKKNITWTEVADAYLTDIMLEQINFGRKDENGFTLEGWKELERLMKDKFGDAYDKSKIRNMLRTLTSHYNHIKTLIGLSGFRWDDVTKKVIASEEVWDDFIKAHPDYEFYRRRNTVDFQKFNIRYGDSIADGRDVLLTNQRPPNPMDAPQANNVDVKVESSNSERRGDGTSKAPPRKRSRSAVSKNEEDLTKAIMQLTGTMTQVVENLIPPPTGPSQSDVIVAVQELNLDRSIRRIAFRLLRDQQACSQFLAFNNADDRRDWLLDELDDSL